MKQKNYETLMYSAVGVAAMVVIVVAVNLIASAFKSRIDLTAGKLYTLSPGTKAILKKLDSPVEVRFYYSRGEARAPSYFKTYAKQIEDLLGEFRQVAGSNLEIKKYDPEPDSEAEDLANLDGVEGQMIETGEKFYLGIAISMDPNKVAIPFLSPAREKMLEYDLARAVSQILSTNKPVVGVMTPLPVMGSQMPPQMMMRTGQQAQEPWTFVTELKKDFDVRQVPLETEKIDDDVKVLLVIHPKEIKETAQYAIDQFVMRGGRLIVCLDSMCLADSQRGNPMMPAMPGGPSNLDKLLKAWGVTFDTTKVVADMNLARQLVLRRGAPAETMPTWLFLKEGAINKEEVVAGQIDEVLMPGAGVFTGTPAAGLKKTVLLQTTKNSQLVEGFMAQMAPQKIIDDFKSSDTVQTLALRLEGKFKTAFPEGKPEAKPDDKDAPKDPSKKPAEKAGDTLKESKSDNAVVLLGDADWLSDNFSVQVQSIPMLNYKIVQPMNGNLPLVQNLVEQFAGDQNLIGVRSRGTLNRPFTVVQEMQARANARFQQQIANVQKEVDETNQKLNELQGKKEPGQRFVLSKEQQDTMEGFKQKRAQANKDLKRVRRDLRKDIDSLELWTKVINIGAVPLAVAMAGLALGFVRKQKTKAQ